MYETVFYQAPRGDYPVLDFIKPLDKKTRAKVYRYIELLEIEEAERNMLDWVKRKG